MNQLQNLQKKAIDAAKKADWAQAAEINREILEHHATDVSALNRLGFSYIQLGKKDEATKAYQRVLELEKLNSIAKKYLDLLKQNVKMNVQNVNVSEDFVEEPRETRIISLDRLADPKVLSKLSVATVCIIKPKGRFICIQSPENEYIGSLPEDISAHLTQLIKTGNEYVCLIRSVSKQECVVFIKEKVVSLENKHIPSFYTANKSQALDSDEDVIIPDMLDPEAAVEGEKELEPEEPEEDEGMTEPLPPDLIGKVMR